MTWKNIKTAPRGGKRFLLLEPWKDYPSIVWLEGDTAHYASGGRAPIHSKSIWHELPNIPTAEEIKEVLK